MKALLALLALASASPAKVAFIAHSRSLHPSVEVANLDGGDVQTLGPAASGAVTRIATGAVLGASFAPSGDDGSEALVLLGFEGTPTSVEMVPWAGGTPTVIAPHGFGGSWDA
jgi:hypothetical protein